MGFDGNFEFWKNFIKSVKKIDNSNILKPTSQKNTRHVQVKSTRNKVNEFADNRRPMPNLTVTKLSRSEIKKFSHQKSLDLHGHTRDVDDVLAKFCSKCILAGIREVVIITGKGEGIVKTATINWLKSHPEFVISFFEIRDSRGEFGSFGIRLRAK